MPMLNVPPGGIASLTTSKRSLSGSTHTVLKSIGSPCSCACVSAGSGSLPPAVLGVYVQENSAYLSSTVFVISIGMVAVDPTSTFTVAGAGGVICRRESSVFGLSSVSVHEERTGTSMCWVVFGFRVSFWSCTVVTSGYFVSLQVSVALNSLARTSLPALPASSFVTSRMRVFLVKVRSACTL